MPCWLFMRVLITHTHKWLDYIAGAGSYWNLATCILHKQSVITYIATKKVDFCVQNCVQNWTDFMKLTKQTELKTVLNTKQTNQTTWNRWHSTWQTVSWLAKEDMRNMTGEVWRNTQGKHRKEKKTSKKRNKHKPTKNSKQSN